MFYSLTIISGVTYTICTLVLLMSPPHSQMRKNSIDGDILSLTNVCAYLSMVSIVIWTILHGIMLEWRREQMNKISFQKQQNINNNQLGANGFVNNTNSHLSNQNHYHHNRHSNSALVMTTQANLSNNYNTSGLNNNVRSSNQILPPGVPSVLMSKQGSSQNLAFGENQQKSNSKLSYHQSNSNLQHHQQQQHQQPSVEESHPTMSGDVAKDDEDEDDRSSRNQSYVEHDADEDEDEYNKYFQGYGSTDDIGEAAAKQNQFGRAVAAAQGNNIPNNSGSPSPPQNNINYGVPQNTSSNFANPASRGYLQSSFVNNNQNDASNRSSMHVGNSNQNNNNNDCTAIPSNASHSNNLSTARSQKSQRPNKPFLWRVLEFLYPLRLLLSIVLTIFYYAIVTILTESKLINGENFSAGLSGFLAIICGVLSAGGTYYLGRSVKAAKRFGLALAILCVFLMLRCVVVIGPVQRSMDRDATPMLLPLIDALSITAVIVVLPSRQFCLCFSTSVEDE